jgi:hypothetical protein
VALHILHKYLVNMLRQKKHVAQLTAGAKLVGFFSDSPTCNLNTPLTQDSGPFLRRFAVVKEPGTSEGGAVGH